MIVYLFRSSSRALTEVFVEVKNTEKISKESVGRSSISSITQIVVAVVAYTVPAFIMLCYAM